MCITELLDKSLTLCEYIYIYINTHILHHAPTRVSYSGKQMSSGRIVLIIIKM